MKVLQVITSLKRASGGSTFCGGLSNALVAQGHEVTVAVPRRNILGDIYPLTNGVRLEAFERVIDSKENFDVVHIHGIWEWPDHQAAIWARKRNIPYVISTHGSTAPWAMKHRWWKKAPLWGLFFERDLKNAAFIHVTAEAEARWNRDLGFSQTIIEAPLGTDLPSIGSTNRQTECNVLLFVGRIHPVKAIDRLITAFQAVPHEGWQLRVVGPDQEGYQKELEKITEDDIVFVGPIYGEALKKEYASCKALALVSHTENFGATVVDAMAHSKPVITGTKTPWKIVADRGCGWWVDNDASSLGKAIEDLIAKVDCGADVEMGRRARRLVEDKFTWEAVAQRTSEAYARIVESK